MHSTLTPKDNFKFIAIYFICVVILLTIYKCSILCVAIIGLMLGIPAGYLQLKALSDNWSNIKDVKKAIEIRRSLLATKSGRWFYGYYYFSVVLSLLISYGFTRDNIRNLPSFWFMTTLAIFLARDLITLPFIVNSQKKTRKIA